MSKLSESIAVAETFYSIQGEGPTSGAPSVFLRCSHCNLRCPAWGPPGSPQGCDTTDVWTKVWRRLAPGQIIQYWNEQGWLARLARGAHLILTGGEPTLFQPQLTRLVAELEGTLRPVLSPFERVYVEVETNATLPIEEGFGTWVHQFNCSPKLFSAGNEKSKAYRPEVLRAYAEDSRAVFKFVVQEPLSDVQEIFDNYVNLFRISPSRVWLMPEAATRERLIERSAAVAEICKTYGFNYSSRLQLLLWDKATGV